MIQKCLLIGPCQHNIISVLNLDHKEGLFPHHLHLFEQRFNWNAWPIWHGWNLWIPQTGVRTDQCYWVGTAIAMMSSFLAANRCRHMCVYFDIMSTSSVLVLHVPLAAIIVSPSGIACLLNVFDTWINGTFAGCDKNILSHLSFGQLISRSDCPNTYWKCPVILISPKYSEIH